jgi:5'-3' exonuclease
MQQTIDNTSTSSVEITPTFIFIDGSYFIFHRFYSIMNWWKNANPSNNVNPNEKNKSPIEITNDFIEKYKKTFIEKVQEIPNKLYLLESDINVKSKKKVNSSNTYKPNIYVARDCKRENIWRNELYDSYKSTRNNMDGESISKFFAITYQEELFIKGGVNMILDHQKLEADDCIAISVKHLLNKYEKCKIYIITSDKDYLQLLEPRVKIYNLAYKNIAEEKSSFGDAKTNLFCKIVMGDASDNITSIFTKCGPKTALKCYLDKEYFECKLKKEDAYKKYELNRLLVDFNSIPNELESEFIEKYKIDLF